MALAVVIVLGTTSLALLVVLTISLVRHVKLLNATLARLQAEMSPVLEQLRDGSDRARRHLDGLAERELRPTPGARLGR